MAIVSMQRLGNRVAAAPARLVDRVTPPLEGGFRPSIGSETMSRTLAISRLKASSAWV